MHWRLTLPSTENNEDKSNDSRLSIVRAFAVCEEKKWSEVKWLLVTRSY